MASADLPDWQRTTLTGSTAATLIPRSTVTLPYTSPTVITSLFRSVVVVVEPNGPDGAAPSLLTLEWYVGGSLITSSMLPVWIGSIDGQTPPVLRTSWPVLGTELVVTMSQTYQDPPAYLSVIGTSAPLSSVLTECPNAPGLSCPVLQQTIGAVSSTTPAVPIQPLVGGGSFTIWADASGPMYTIDVAPQFGSNYSGFTAIGKTPVPTVPTVINVPVSGLTSTLNISGSSPTAVNVYIMGGQTG